MGPKEENAWNIPIDHPFYPAPPAHYRDVRYQWVFFRADPAAVGRILPAPLEAHEDGSCVACGMVIPFSSNYGAFEEIFLLEKCRFRGEDGWYCSHVFHNGPAGIAAGREIYGTPKVYADLEFNHRNQAMVITARMAGLPVVTVASTYVTPCELDEMPTIQPCWRLKLIPRADGPGAAIKQLLDSSFTYNVKQKVMFRGTGTVEFSPNPLCDLTDLEPLEYFDAFYIESDHSEGYAKIVHDYLAEE